MHVRLYDPIANDSLLTKEYPDRYSSEWHTLSECTTNLQSALGEGFYKEIYFEGVHIGYGHARLMKSAKFAFESDFESVEMHFTLKGESLANSSRFDRGIRFSPNQHNIIYANQIQGEMHWNDKDLQLFEVNLEPAFFQKYLPQEQQVFDSFHNKIINQQSDLLQASNMLISQQMGQVINDIIACKRTGLFKRMYLESKIIELLMLQLEQLANDERPTSFKKADIDKIYAVKEFISQNMDRQISLIDMAHQFGTNEFTLKKGFKELFGNTVFGFWNDLKMTEAMRMLREQEMLVNEVADAIGYQNARHFSTAFTRKFGITPSQIKKGIQAIV